MEMVQVSVEYIEGKEAVFGVLLIGVIAGSHIYARRVSVETFRPMLDYLKISKDLTVEATEKVESLFEAKCRSITVSLENGLSDERFETIAADDDVIHKIDEAIAAFQKAATSKH